MGFPMRVDYQQPEELKKVKAELRELRACVPLERSQAARLSTQMPIACVQPANTSLQSDLQSHGDDDVVVRDTSQQGGNAVNSASPTPTKDYDVREYVTETAITVSSAESDEDWEYNVEVHLSRMSPPILRPPPPLFTLPGRYYSSGHAPNTRSCFTAEVI